MARQAVSVSFRFPELPLLWFRYQWLGKVLAARFDVLLPHLLYRTTRGLQVIKRLSESLSPNAGHDGPLSAEAAPYDTGTLPSFPHRISATDRRDSLSRPSTSIRLITPLGVGARLNSLTSNSPSRANRPSSSVLKLYGTHRRE
jgi:hypothetical protein